MVSGSGLHDCSRDAVSSAPATIFAEAVSVEIIVQSTCACSGSKKWATCIVPRMGAGGSNHTIYVRFHCGAILYGIVAGRSRRPLAFATKQIRGQGDSNGEAGRFREGYRARC